MLERVHDAGESPQYKQGEGMTHLHIRVPTKTRLHELKMAWFFRNSLGSIFDDYSKFIIFNKIFSETNYISEHDINTLFRPPCLGRNL